MPTYQYACTSADCGHRFELVQSFTDPAASECPTCRGPVRKVFSAVGVVFKGSGFYRTDSRSNGSSSSASSSSPKSEANGSGGESSKGGSTSTSSESKSTATSGGSSDSKVAAST